MVSAAASPYAANLRTFAVMPGPGITPASDFENVSNVLVLALIERGFVLATLDDAEIIIGVDYRPANSTHSYTSTAPVYGTVPGPVSRINATTMPIGSSNGPLMTTGTISNIPTVGVVGQQTQTNTILISGLKAEIGAYGGAEMRRSARLRSRVSPKAVWIVEAYYFTPGRMAQSEMASLAMRAAAKYAGSSTGGPIDVSP